MAFSIFGAKVRQIFDLTNEKKFFSKEKCIHRLRCGCAHSGCAMQFARDLRPQYADTKTRAHRAHARKGF